MTNLLKDLAQIYSSKFHIRRIPLRDRIKNTWNVIKWNLIKGDTENYSPAHKPGYKLVFEENFETENWGPFGLGKWKIGEGWGLWHPGKPNAWYGPPSIDRDRKLARFTVRYNPREFVVDPFSGKTITIPYEVSLLSSEFWFRRKYGRFECRMTLPDNPYSFPAFWLWGSPPYAEIDVYEGNGKTTGKTVVYQNINLHWVDEQGVWRDTGVTRIKVARMNNFQGKFFEFALEWTPDRIEIFTNGHKVFEFTDKEVIRRRFNHPLWIVLNNSIIPSYEGKEKFTSEFYVDYVRVYDINPKEK